jgi:hypothetical protein
MLGTDSKRSKAPFKCPVTALRNAQRAKATGTPNNVVVTQELVSEDMKVPINRCGYHRRQRRRFNAE